MTFKDHHTGLRGECSNHEVTLRIIAEVSEVSVALRGDFKDHYNVSGVTVALRGDFKEHPTCLRGECSTQR